MGIFNCGHRSIDEYAYDEVDLGLTWDVIKSIHWAIIWVTHFMISEDFLGF